MADNKRKTNKKERPTDRPKITMQLKEALPDGSYTSAVLSKMFNMLVDMDLLRNIHTAREKWGFLSSIGNLLADFAKLPADFGTENRKTAEETREAIEAVLVKISEYYEQAQFRYKEAGQILDGLQLQNKSISQIITLYYFVTNDIDPKEQKPLTDEQKEGLTAIAWKMDDFYTSNQETDPIEKYLTDDFTDIPEQYQEAREFFAYFPFVISFMRLQGISDLTTPEPEQNNKINATASGQETITSEIHGETLDRLQLNAEFLGTAAGEAQPRQLELPFLPPITPKYYVMPNNALMNDIEKKQRINYGAYDLDVFGQKSDITSYIQITYEPDPESGITIKGPERLTAYERTVSNAIISLWEQAQKDGNKKPVISPEMIYRAMPGSGEKLSGGQKSAIVKAVKRFQILHIYVDATTEMQKRKVIGEKEKFELDSNYLLTTHAEYRAQNGRTVHAYRIEAEPLILTYSKAAKQLLSIPAKYLDIRQVKNGEITDKPIRMSADRQTITDYLLRRIAIMKRDAQNKKQTQSHIIKFDEIYKIADLENKPRDQKKEIRDFCFDVLEYQTAAGNISGYKKLKEGREIAKTEILL